MSDDGFGDGIKYGVEHVLDMLTFSHAHNCFIVTRKQLLMDYKTRNCLFEREAAKKKAKANAEQENK